MLMVSDALQHPGNGVVLRSMFLNVDVACNTRSKMLGKIHFLSLQHGCSLPLLRVSGFQMSHSMYSLLRFLSKVWFFLFFPLTSLTKQALQVKPAIANFTIACTAFWFFWNLSLAPVINKNSDHSGEGSAMPKASWCTYNGKLFSST